MSLTQKKHDIIIFRDCIRFDSEKGDIEKTQKYLLISANKNSLFPGIHFYETAIIFLLFYEVFAKSWRF